MDVAEKLLAEASTVVSRSRRTHTTQAANANTTETNIESDDDVNRLSNISIELANTLDGLTIADEVSRADRGRALFFKGKLAWLLHSAAAAIPSPSASQKQQQHQHSADAEDALTKSVKLDPSSMEAWNLLGDLLGERGEYETARDCFTRSIAQAPNKKALRDLAMVMRKLGETPKEKSELTMSSLGTAKQAVALDVKDSESWYVLGMSYLAIFFALSHKLADLTSALKAFKRAVSLTTDGIDANPDLYFNRGQVYSYLEDYPSALQDFRTAELLDPTLPVSDRIDVLHRRVVRATEMVGRRGCFKSKRLIAISKTFRDSKRAVRSPKEAAVSGVTKKMGDMILRNVTLSELEEGSNEGVSLDVKLLMPLSSSELPVSLLVMDRDMKVFVLSVYHLDQSALDKIKAERDQITVVAPELKNVRYDANTSRFHHAGVETADVASVVDGASMLEYPLVHVRSPVDLLINDDPVDTAFFAHAAMHSRTMANYAISA